MPVGARLLGWVRMSKKGKKTLVPKWRFPVFRDSGEWKFIPLQNLAKRCSEKNIEGKLLRVLTNSAEHGVINQRDYFGKDIAIQGNLEGYFIVKKGDYVYNPRISAMAPVGPISKNNIATGVMSPLYTVFRFKVENDDFYMHYFKTSGWHQYMRQVSSTGARYDRMAISKDDFIAMPVPIAPMEAEQLKIADCLTSIDELISGEANKLEAYKAHKKGLMQKLFPTEGEVVPEWRFPEFQGNVAWELKPLNTIGQTINGLSGKSGDDFGTGQPFVTYKQVFDSASVDFSKCGKVKISDDEKQNTLQLGDILFTTSSETPDEVGYASILLYPPFEATYLNSFCFSLRPYCLQTLRPEFSCFLFHSPIYRKLVAILAQGSTRYNISKSAFLKLALPIPKEKEQKKIADCLTSLDKLINAQAQKIEALKTHKKGLMQGLFPSADEVGV